MQIRRIELHNFGVYRGKVEFDFSTSKQKPVVLVCGLNGRGKTTLLDGIKLGLYGKFARCSNRNTSTYEQFLLSSINRGVARSEGASITIDLRLANKRAGDLRITRSWVAKNSGVKEHLDVLVDGEHDPSLADQWDRFIHQVLPVEVSQLFFFDGEQVEQIAESDNARETIRLGVNALLGIDLIQQLGKDLTYMIRRKVAEESNDEAKKKLLKAEAEHQVIEQSLATIVKERARVQKELDLAKTASDKLRKEYSGRGGKLLEKRDELLEQRRVLVNQLQSIEDQMRFLATGLLPLTLLRKNIQRAQKTAEATESAKHQAMISDAVKKRDSETVGKLTELGAPRKLISELETRLEPVPDEHTPVELFAQNWSKRDLDSISLDELKSAKSNAKRLVIQQKKLRIQIDNLDLQLADVPSNEEIAEITNSLNEAESRVAALSPLITNLEEERNNLNKRHRESDERVSRYSSDIAIQEMKGKQRESAISRVDTVRKVLAEFGNRAVIDALESLSTRILESFQNLVGKQSLIARLEIDTATYSIRLYDSNGEEFDPSRLSAGERQLLATSILWGLAKSSGLGMPLVVDTPLGRLDGVHRSLLVKNYFPSASHQVIVLSTDEEISAERYAVLKPSIIRSYSLVYDERENITRVEKGYGRWLESDRLEATA